MHKKWKSKRMMNYLLFFFTVAMSEQKKEIQKYLLNLSDKNHLIV